MKYDAINKRYSEIVAEWLGKGYVINTMTMGGSQGEIAKVDLTDGKEIIRIMCNNFHAYSPSYLDGISIIVGRAQDEIKPHRDGGHDTIWNSRLEFLNVEQFFKIGENRNGGWYGTREEAQAAKAIDLERYQNSRERHSTKDITAKTMPIAKRIIQREFKAKRICEADVRVLRTENRYTVEYRGKCYRLK